MRKDLFTELFTQRIISVDADENSVQIQNPRDRSDTKLFKFSRVYDDTALTSAIYADVCLDLVKQVGLNFQKQNKCLQMLFDSSFCRLKGY